MDLRTAFYVMRLKPAEYKIIKQSVSALDKSAKIYLFGSRADDRAKGGDIDLLIISSKLNYGDKLKIKHKLFESLEEQKIDIVIAKDFEQPFIKLLPNIVLL
jgi:predicted nucleotidyltransferase